MKMNTDLTGIAQKFARDERGTTAIEYGLIGGIVGVGLVASLGNLSTGLTSQFGLVASWF